ncbi:hypothetical protein IZ6_05480 [Terrihabitans soli]|uniref:Outer membrane beta-barrel protein n=1 Tax=Terrihabitans soli TaxID=708113 RepID=A0A6S6QFF1_9HYPH|nr:hypothetical protein IZ6_05480 [Terrihabitans soli]
MLLLASAASAQEIRGSLEALPGADDDFAPDALGIAPDSAFAEDPDNLAEEPLEDLRGVEPPPLAEPEERLKRKKRPEEDNPFDPVGIRAGAFLFKPTFDAYGGYETNPTSTEENGGSLYGRSEGRLDIESDWARHAFRGRLEAEYTAYEAFEDLNAPRLAADGALRLDAHEDLRIDLLARTELDSESPGDPEVPDGVKGRPENLRMGAGGGITYKPNRLSLRLKGDVDRRTYEDAELNNGSTVDNEDRNYTAYRLGLRTGYELHPGFEPFAEIEGNRREYDLDENDSGLQHNTEGYKAYAGVRLEPNPIWSFEGAIGYGHLEAEDPFEPKLDDFIAKASLIWQPTVKTKVTLTAEKDVSSGGLSCCAVAREVSASVEIEHELQRNFFFTASLDYERSFYPRADYTLQDVDAEIALEYRFNRTVSARLRAAHQISDSSNDGEDYDTSLIEIGLRVQR